MTLRLITVALLLAAASAFETAASAGGIDSFPLGFKQTVSPGVPGPGAGSIEAAGNEDLYVLSVAQPTTLFLDQLSSFFGMTVQLVAPNASQVFAAGASDIGPVALTQVGDYTLRIKANGAATGTYSLILWETQEDFFTIGLEQTVSLGDPGPGAGSIEDPGNEDKYQFTILAPTSIYLDTLATFPGGEVSLLGPNGVQIYGAGLFDAGPFALSMLGTYTLRLGGNAAATGSYSFLLWETENDTFEISLGEVVAPGAPGAGAGSIEEPGNRDFYPFEIAAPTVICFDSIASFAGMTVTIVAPNGTQVISFGGSDVGGISLTQVGTYTVRVAGTGAGIGSYSFVVQPDSSADLNNDCHVDGSDLGLLLGGWGGTNGDLNDDGTTDGADLGILLGDWTG